MESILRENRIQAVIRSTTVLVFVFLGNINIFAQETDDEYIPFVEEGKTWIYSAISDIYGTPIGRDVYFTMNGNTVINDKTYKKVYCKFVNYYKDSEQHYFCAVREESLRVFIVEPDTEEEKLLYDFSLPDEKLELSYDDQTFVRNSGTIDEHFSNMMNYKLYESFDAINHGYSGIGVWKEGVGAVYVNPFACELYGRSMTKFPCPIELLYCMKSNGEYIWRPFSTPINSIRETFNENPEDIVLYDLQGRRLNNKPCQGIYIQNGKKVVIK